MQRLASWQLFAICVLTWGTTWYVITRQIDSATPELGVALRFSLAAILVLAYCAWRRERLRFSLAQHGLLALQGALMYSVSYIAVYHAERHVPSGLVAVGYSASPLLNGLGARALFGAPLTRRFIVGGIAAVAGVALIFLPQFRQAAGDGAATALGAAFTVAAVVLSSAGSLTASRNREHAIAFWPALGFGMAWSGALSWAIVIGLGQTVAPPQHLQWWTSLLYLSLAGSVLTFACFLTLVERVGPGRAATIGVMTPLLALAISIAIENYRADASTLAGVALAVAGNALMLRR